MNSKAVPSGGWSAVALSVPFGVTLFVSAFLCFAVQPMFGKMALPLLGGTPAVWNTCVIFFQATLLAGYWYAHVLTTRLGIARQVAVHGMLLVLVIFSLPVNLPQGWSPPTDRNPVLWLLLMLLVSVGAPFFLVSASTPLLQRWFSATSHRSAKDPYFLYAVSNAGSLLALLSYPFLVEPRLSLVLQRAIWSAGYIVLVVLTLTCAAVAWRRRASPVSIAEVSQADVSPRPISWRRRGQWLAWAFVPSSLMLAVTTHLSTDIAAVPLLWIVPLTIYLLSFVIVFTPNRMNAPELAHQAMPLFLLPVVLILLTRLTQPVWLVVPLDLIVFFICATVLHGRLAADRPPPRQLTGFYVWIGVGGLLGGVLNTLVAPLVFTRIVEYPIALVLACLLRPASHHGTPRWPSVADVALPLGYGVTVVGVLAAMDAGVLSIPVAGGLLGGVLVFSHRAWKRPLRFASIIGLMLLAAELLAVADRDLLASKRTFFGVYQATERDGYRTLIHGTTVHGRQSVDPAHQQEPLTYYHTSGPIGQAIESLSPRLASASVGVVGLGAGSLAAYARAGQRWTFYEIDPVVERIARDVRLFSYLDACGARCAVVLGDARLSLGRFGGRHDLIVFDAFTSDAIPVHLLTREALDLYLTKVAKDGVLAFHISNRHLVLAPVLAALAMDRGLVARAQTYLPSASASGSGALPSQWFVVARSEAALGPMAQDPRWERPLASAGTRRWTDDFSDIVGVLKLR